VSFTPLSHSPQANEEAEAEEISSDEHLQGSWLLGSRHAP